MMKTQKSPVCSLIVRQMMLASLVAPSLLGAAAAVGEEKPLPSLHPAASLKDGAVPEVRIYRIKNADANSIVRTLVSMELADSKSRIQSDARTNSVIVAASAETQRRIAQLIEKLDIAEPDKSIPIGVLSLEGRGLAKSALPILVNLFGKEGARFAVDPNTNTLIVQAPKTIQLAVRELLDRLERESMDNRDERKVEAASVSHIVQVRAIWLASGLADDNLPEPAEDLKDVIAELSKIGVEQLRQVGQSIVRTTSDGSFRLSCSPAIGQELGEWSIDGRFVPSRNGQELPQMQIELTASKPEVPGGAATRRSGKVTLAEVKTVVTAPYGHFVVLGVTPVAKATSVFVVQVTRDD